MLNEDISILYIDDDELMLDYFKTILAVKVGKIITATSGTEGVNKFFENLPDIVIVDIIMPDINGIEVAVKIKEKYKETEIIAVSSSDSSKNLIGAINAGIRNFILKPVSADKIYEVIEELSKNIRIKRELKEYKEKLEGLVEIRTDRLQRTSEKLLEKIDEKESIEKRYSVMIEIIEQSPFGIVITDDKFNIEYINNRVLTEQKKILLEKKYNNCFLK